MPQFVCRVPHCKRARRGWAFLCPECWKRVPANLKGELHETPPQERREVGVKIIRWFTKDQRNFEL